MKLTEEEKQRIEKYSARIIAEAEISSIADKLFPKLEIPLGSIFSGLGLLFSGVASVFIFMGEQMKDQNSPFFFLYLGFDLVLTGGILLSILQIKETIYNSKRLKWEKQALADWQKTGELPK